MKKFLLLIYEYLNGDFAYKKYLQHHKKNHPGAKSLNKEEFLREKLRKKTINRCC